MGASEPSVAEWVVISTRKPPSVYHALDENADEPRPGCGYGNRGGPFLRTPRADADAALSPCSACFDEEREQCPYCESIDLERAPDGRAPPRYTCLTCRQSFDEPKKTEESSQNGGRSASGERALRRLDPDKPLAVAGGDPDG